MANQVAVCKAFFFFHWCHGVNVWKATHHSVSRHNINKMHVLCQHILQASCCLFYFKTCSRLHKYRMSARGPWHTCLFSYPSSSLSSIYIYNLPNLMRIVLQQIASNFLKIFDKCKTYLSGQGSGSILVSTIYIAVLHNGTSSLSHLGLNELQTPSSQHQS